MIKGTLIGKGIHEGLIIIANINQGIIPIGDMAKTGIQNLITGEASIIEAEMKDIGINLKPEITRRRGDKRTVQGHDPKRRKN